MALFKGASTPSPLQSQNNLRLLQHSNNNHIGLNFCTRHRCQRDFNKRNTKNMRIKNKGSLQHYTNLYLNSQTQSHLKNQNRDSYAKIVENRRESSKNIFPQHQEMEESEESEGVIIGAISTHGVLTRQNFRTLPLNDRQGQYSTPPNYTTHKQNPYLQEEKAENVRKEKKRNYFC